MSTIYDLHCHSTASDGVLSPTDVVNRAAQKGVNVLALTDHDTVSGISEAKKAACQQGITFINGVEISTLWENRAIHIVGLGFDETSEKLTALLTQQAVLRHQRAIEIGEKLAKVGVENAFEEAKKLATGEVTRAHYARLLVQLGKVANENQAFKKYLSQGKSCYVKSQWCDIPTAIDIIHQSGGLAVLAHPLRYTMTTKWLKKLIADFKLWGGDALEVAGCGQTKEQRLLLARWAKENKLLSSVGSDFHFPCGWIELGKSLQLPDDCLPIWHRLKL
ncbi:PHP domain-containing protein [Pasteurella canis]|uniref:Protein TrpH n=1 Tax=Pasteurella canis TaxID=753 RepID=A0A379EUH4_9PAST|nr:PHP domain-containing protein [Pasteurella canis]UAY78340.1 PHP domain-containing protein [Pasteurella canis]UDW84422.1 PHP domain-containing protein [Pasteurella canis]SPY33124.1 protein TrpH [Pasteurella canis]SUC09794.1 protein TrpH [Pasteurella canis]GJJ79365.1 5'-3' exoribonuclease [Pasteurella canis]